MADNPTDYPTDRKAPTPIRGGVLTGQAGNVDLVLAERLSRDGRVRWQARRSADRGRLIVVGVVQPSDTETLVEPLNETQLRELLEGEAHA